MLGRSPQHHYGLEKNGSRICMFLSFLFLCFSRGVFVAACKDGRPALFCIFLLLSDGEVFRIRFLRGRLSLNGMLLAARGIFWTERLYGIPTPTVFKLRQEKASEVRMSNGVRDPLSKRITSVKSRSFLCQMAVGQDTNAWNTNESSRDTQYRLKNGGLNFWVGEGCVSWGDISSNLEIFSLLFSSSSWKGKRDERLSIFLLPRFWHLFPELFSKAIRPKKGFSRRQLTGKEEEEKAVIFPSISDQAKMMNRHRRRYFPEEGKNFV